MMRSDVGALGRHVRPREGMVMRLSSSFVAPSAVAVLSTVLLFGPATSQTATPATAPLPTITVEAPKQVARPHRPKQVENAVASRRASSTARAPSSTGQTQAAAPGSILGRIAKLEKSASSCNGGCETSFKSGNAPWVGCSLSGGYFSTYSSTCRDTLTYKSFLDCTETKVFLGWETRRVLWYCNSLQASGQFQVAELKRSRHSR
jgi:hypothetical protein